MPKVTGGGVNSEGNKYTTYSNGGYRYSNAPSPSVGSEGSKGSHYYAPSASAASSGSGFFTKSGGKKGDGYSYYQNSSGSRSYKSADSESEPKAHKSSAVVSKASSSKSSSKSASSSAYSSSSSSSSSSRQSSKRYSDDDHDNEDHHVVASRVSKSANKSSSSSSDKVLSNREIVDSWGSYNNFMLSYGIKPWEVGAHDEAMEIRRTLASYDSDE